ncbi:MAG: 3'-5' exonuclease domain-containing protein 2 [Prevotella sp.]|nr:3'-5' exonuclease domain-containing protein 2 [Prevotella sp.]
MKKIIYNKFDKKAIAALPVVAFQGRIITVITPGETERAVDFLLKQPILGVDTETRPSFQKGQQYSVALLQVSTHDTCFLFRLNHTGLTPAIIRLLEDTTVPKIGLSWHDDILSLSRRASFVPGYFIDLQKLVGQIGIQDLSLQKLYANLFGQKITKREQLSNWERPILNDKQKLYAATDAWACIMLYEEVLRLERTGNYKLVEVEETPKEEVSQPVAEPENKVEEPKKTPRKSVQRKAKTTRKPKKQNEV